MGVRKEARPAISFFKEIGLQNALDPQISRHILRDPFAMYISPLSRCERVQIPVGWFGILQRAAHFPVINPTPAHLLLVPRLQLRDRVALPTFGYPPVEALADAGNWRKR